MPFFKKIIFIVLLILFNNSNLFSQNYWVPQVSPVQRNFDVVFFINVNTGWIAGDSGTVIKTTNNGDSWEIQNTGTYNDIVDIFFVNERIGWAISWVVFPDSTNFLGTVMLSTSDGGSNWSQSNFGKENWYMKTLFFLDSLTGFTGGAPGGVFKTTNGGGRWNLTEIDTTSLVILPVESIKFYDNLNGYVSGGFRDLAGSMWKSTNGGLLWKIFVVGPEPLNDLYINSFSDIIAVGGDFEYGSSYVRSTDAGNEWIYDTLGVFGIARAIDFRTPSEGWISIGDRFCFTTNTGNNWTSFYNTDSLRINDFCFTDSLYGWAAGFNSSLLKYEGTISNVSSNSEQNNPDLFYLSQNYPNPFNPYTNISFTQKKHSVISLKIYDALGKEVAVLINGYNTAGNYNVRFDGKNFASGVYFYELKSSDFSAVKKMVLIK